MKHCTWTTSKITRFVVFTLSVVMTPSVHAALFMDLGDLPGGRPPDQNTFGSGPRISGDGSVVVGRSDSSNGREAFRWTLETGMEGLGDLPGGVAFDGSDFGSRAGAVSYDGRVIVGAATSSRGHSPDRSGNEAFRWTAESGMQGLGHLPGSGLPGVEVYSSAKGVSGDGSVIVGISTSTTAGTNGTEVFRWTQDGGMEGLGFPGGFNRVFSTSISNDGQVIIGTFSPLPWSAWRWTRELGFTDLGSLPGATSTRANDVTPDGSIIVGASGTTVGASDEYQPFRWTEESGMVPLAERWDAQRFGATRSSFISDDGSTIVGSSYTTGGPYEPFMWDEDNGVRELREVLVTDHGLGAELAGWPLLRAVTGISGDGRRIVGNGLNAAGQYAAWIAILDPLVPLLEADFDNDGDVDGDDFNIMAMNLGVHLDRDVAFADGDFNLDSRVDLVDFNAFKAAFPAVFAAATGIPEPATLVMSVLSLTCLFSSQWRQIKGVRTY